MKSNLSQDYAVCLFEIYFLVVLPKHIPDDKNNDSAILIVFADDKINKIRTMIFVFAKIKRLREKEKVLVKKKKKKHSPLRSLKLAITS